LKRFESLAESNHENMKARKHGKTCLTPAPSGSLETQRNTEKDLTGLTGLTGISSAFPDEKQKGLVRIKTEVAQILESKRARKKGSGLLEFIGLLELLGFRGLFCCMLSTGFFRAYVTSS